MNYPPPVEQWPAKALEEWKRDVPHQIKGDKALQDEVAAIVKDFNFHVEVNPTIDTLYFWYRRRVEMMGCAMLLKQRPDISFNELCWVTHE